MPYHIDRASPLVGRFLLFLIRLHFKRWITGILITDLLFAAKNDPATINFLTALLFELHCTVPKEV